MANDPQKDNLDDILSALHDEQATVRATALQQLLGYVTSVGSEEFNGSPTEGPTLESLESWNRAYVQQMQDRRIGEALLGAIEDTSARVRIHAASLLGSVRTLEAEQALLRHLRNDPVDQVRAMCLSSLGPRSDAQNQLQDFIAALQDSSDQVVSGACLILDKIGHPQAIEPLQAVLSRSNWHVRFSACEALVRLKGIDLHGVNLLEELNQQPDAQQYNEMVQKANEFNAGFEMRTMESQARMQTTQTILDQARRLLTP